MMIMINKDPLILLEDQGVIRVRGQDAENYLQGLITIDIRAIDQTQSQFGGCCNNKGRVVASFDLLMYQEAYYLILPRANILNTLAHLRKYAMFSKVEIEDATNHFKILGLWSEHDFPLKLNWPEKAGRCVQIKNGVFTKLFGNVPRYRVMLEGIQAEENFPTLKFSKDASLLSKWIQSDIVSGLSAIYPETTALFTPQMLNYDDFGAINLTKGCYLGQEIVARTASLGRVKKHLYPFYFQAAQLPERGAPLYDDNGNEVGIVLQASREEARVNLAAVVQDDALRGMLYYQDNALIRS